MEEGAHGGYGRLKEDTNSPPPKPGYEMNSGQELSSPITTPQHQAHTSINTSTTVIAPNATSIIRTQTVPNDYLGLAIFTTICCCWPVGILAIMSSRDVYKSALEGDMAASKTASDSAKHLSFIALFMGIFIILLSVLIPVLLSFA